MRVVSVGHLAGPGPGCLCPCFNSGRERRETGERPDMTRYLGKEYDVHRLYVAVVIMIRCFFCRQVYFGIISRRL